MGQDKKETKSARGPGVAEVVVSGYHQCSPTRARKDHQCSSARARKDQPSSPTRVRLSGIEDIGEPGVSFVELCARSCFSFLRGASHPEEMVEQALRLGYDGLAIVDLDGLYGVVRGWQTARSPSFFAASVQETKPFRYRLGAEIFLSDLEESVMLLPLNLRGYQNLCQLLTLGKREAAKGFSRLQWAELVLYQSDLLIFCSPELWPRLRPLCGDRLYLPVYRDLTWDSLQHYQKSLRLEQTMGAQLFVTQKPWLHSAERKPLFDVLTCIHHGTTLEKAHNILALNGERVLRPLPELARIWRDRPDLLSVTVEIADRIEFDLSQIQYQYPQARLPENTTPTQWLRELTERGLSWRFPQGVASKVRSLVEKELRIISDLSYENYFLTLYEICEFAREKEILYQGRGSAANSVVCFALGLTAVDPTQVDLLFERFISKERGEPPDIDIDFEHERREEVIQYIYRRYDVEHAAMVCTVIRYRSRLALREAAKVFGISVASIEAMVRWMGRDGIRRLQDESEDGKKFGIEPGRWKQLLHIVQQLYGMPRHLGIHTGGFLITQDPITHFVPVEKATMEGRYVIQWNKDDIQHLALMKIDVLSLGMLTALSRCLKILRQKKNLIFDLATLPAEDAATYEMISRADTVGVFQIESRAQMNTLPRMQPRTFYDLVIEVAIIRPGPLQGGMVHPFLKRRQGIEEVTYAHPDLRPVLEKTMGVPIFQEQVMKIAVVAAGFSPGEADELRRIMSAAWRRKGTMEGVRERVLQGMDAKGISRPFAEQIYRTIEGFANYGFPESHAASFALLTYASCWIKCHHPDVFLVALLNSQPMGFYSPRSLIADAQRHGVKIEPIDLVHSQVEATLIVPGVVRLGLESIAKISRGFFDRLVAERERRSFASLEDFVRRSGLPKAVLTRLAAAGALRVFSHSPRQMIWQIEALQLDSQSFLWGHARESDDLEDMPFESNWDRMQREMESHGFAVDLHPIFVLRTKLEQENEEFIRRKWVPYVSSQRLEKLRDGAVVRVAGLVGVHQRPPTAKGVCFITLEDEFGFINVVIGPEVYQKYRMTIYGQSLLEIRGRLEKRHAGIINLQASAVLPLRVWQKDSVPTKDQERF